MMRSKEGFSDLRRSRRDFESFATTVLSLAATVLKDLGLAKMKSTKPHIPPTCKNKLTSPNSFPFLYKLDSSFAMVFWSTLPAPETIVVETGALFSRKTATDPASTTKKASESLFLLNTMSPDRSSISS
eukprot:12269902-Ditylum_brightwellii.AAC.1